MIRSKYQFLFVVVNKTKKLNSYEILEEQNQSKLADWYLNEEKIFEKSTYEVKKYAVETNHAFMNLSSNNYDELKHLRELALYSTKNQLLQTEMELSV